MLVALNVTLLAAVSVLVVELTSEPDMVPSPVAEAPAVAPPSPVVPVKTPPPAPPPSPPVKEAPAPVKVAVEAPVKVEAPAPVKKEAPAARAPRPAAPKPRVRIPKAAVQTGVVRFRYFPASATVTIDGKTVSTPGTNRVAKDLSAGRHTSRLTAFL